jgi:phospholipase A1
MKMYLPIPMLLLAVCSVSFSHAKSTTAISTYEDTYFLGTYADNIDEDLYADAGETELAELDDFEIKYQISFSFPLLQFNEQSALMTAYTQLSLWQIANSKASSPFRETNYKPQLFMMHQGDYPLFNSIEYGYKHQSNGRGNEISRSWERFYLLLESRGNYIDYGIEYWVASDLSDNRDIEDYIGPYSGWIKINGVDASVNIKVTSNFSTHNSGIEAGFTYYISDMVGLYGQVWKGYGETLIDYNNDQTRIGAGIMLRPF